MNRFISKKKLMKRLSLQIITVLVLTIGSVFSCQGQSNPNCDPIIIENPAWERERDAYEQTINEQGSQINALGIEVAGQKSQIDNQAAQIRDLIDKQYQFIADIDSLKASNELLSEKVISLQAELENATGSVDTVLVEADYITVSGVQYKVADITYIAPEKEFDTVVVSHCDSTKLTTWFHHGGTSNYPHWISFATPEFGMIKVMFKDSLTNEIKVQPEYVLKRVRDHKLAETWFEFIR